MIYLDLDDLLHVARRTLGEVQVRDLGLLGPQPDPPVAGYRPAAPNQH